MQALIVYIATAQTLSENGSEPVHYSSVLCIGRELQLIDCWHDSSTGNCFANLKAGVQCKFDFLRMCACFNSMSILLQQ
jgi:hypothetical protein